MTKVNSDFFMKHDFWLKSLELIDQNFLFAKYSIFRIVWNLLDKSVKKVTILFIDPYFQ